MSPEPAQEHSQKWSLSLWAQGCAGVLWLRAPAGSSSPALGCVQAGGRGRAEPVCRAGCWHHLSTARADLGQGQPGGPAAGAAPARLSSDLLCTSSRFAAQMWDLPAGPLPSPILYLRHGHGAQGMALGAQDLCLVGGNGVFVL